MRKEILQLLEKNSRLTPAEIAVMIGSDEETVANEIKAMENENMIDTSGLSAEQVAEIILQQ